MKYICKHCKSIGERDSEKEWIKSYCEKTGKIVHLMPFYCPHITTLNHCAYENIEKGYIVSCNVIINCPLNQ
jgi:uncharacterized OB-fold protein